MQAATWEAEPLGFNHPPVAALAGLSRAGLQAGNAARGFFGPAKL
jgi:hypothetical protein